MIHQNMHVISRHFESRLSFLARNTNEMSFLAGAEFMDQENREKLQKLVCKKSFEVKQYHHVRSGHMEMRRQDVFTGLTSTVNSKQQKKKTIYQISDKDLTQSFGR